MWQQRQVSMYFKEDGFSRGNPLPCNRAVRHTDETRHSPWPLHELSTLTIFILDTLAEQRASPVTYKCQFYSLCLKHSPYSELSPLSSGQCGVNGWREQSGQESCEHGHKTVQLLSTLRRPESKWCGHINFHDSSNTTIQLTLTH